MFYLTICFFIRQNKKFLLKKIVRWPICNTHAG